MSGRREELPGWTFRRFGAETDETDPVREKPEVRTEIPEPAGNVKGGRNMAIKVYDGGRSGDQWAISFSTVIGMESTISDTINRYCRENGCIPVNTCIAYCEVGLGTLVVTAIVRKQ